MNRRNFIKDCLLGVGALFLLKIENTNTNTNTNIPLEEYGKALGIYPYNKEEYEELGISIDNEFSSDYYFLGDDCKLSFDYTEYGLLLTGLEILE